MSNEAPRCQHIKTNGTQCGSPAVREKQFCYYHEHCHGVTFNYRGMYRDYKPFEMHLPPFEDVHSVQFTLREVTELILRHKIDVKEGGLILYALAIASSNLKRLQREEPKPEQIVSDVEIKHPVETAEEVAEFEELQDDEIDRIYGCADESTNGPADLPPATIHACIEENAERCPSPGAPDLALSRTGLSSRACRNRPERLRKQTEVPNTKGHLWPLIHSQLRYTARKVDDLTYESELRSCR